MSELYVALKLAHVLSAAILFGTGLGIAFFMLMAWRSENVAAFSSIARFVVWADFLFTASAVVVQPLTGVGLIHVQGHDWRSLWLVSSYALFGFTGLFWLPVVWIQMRVARILSVATNGPISPEVRRLMWIWFWCGWPAFGAVIAIYVLMIAKPA